MSKDIAKLANKLAKISAEIGKMENDGNNGSYGFISYKSLEAKLRVSAQTHNVAFIPKFTDYEDKELINNAGKKYTRSIVKGTMLIVCGETGATLEGAFIGGEQDYGGKSMGQAVTEATKRFYFKLFHVSDKEADPDDKTFDDEILPEKEDNTKLIDSLLKIAKEKGYTEQEVYKCFPDGINNYNSDAIRGVIDNYMKKPHKTAKWLIKLAKDTDVTIVNIEKKCQELFKKDFKDLTTDQMSEIKKVLEGGK